MNLTRCHCFILYKIWTLRFVIILTNESDVMTNLSFVKMDVYWYNHSSISNKYKLNFFLFFFNENMSSSNPMSGKSCDIKDFLYAWLGKQSKVPSYEISQQGTKQRIRFKCEVRFNFLILLKFRLIYFFFSSRLHRIHIPLLEILQIKKMHKQMLLLIFVNIWFVKYFFWIFNKND